jgi:VWFA-related protein
MEQKPSQSRPMTVLVSATDSNGLPVSGLTKESVRVMDTGHADSVLSLQAAETLPIQLVVILNSSRNTFKQQQAAAIDLLQKLMRPGKDEAVVLNAGGEKLMEGQVNWETDSVKLAAAIKSLDYKVGLPDAFSYSIQPDRAGMNRSGLEVQGGSNTSVFEIAWRLMVEDKRAMRRVVVTFRNPMNHSPGLGNQRFYEYVSQRHDQIIATAQALRATIFTIVTDEPGSNASGNVDIGQGYVPMTSWEASQDQVRHYDEALNRNINTALSSGRQNVERMAIDTGGKASLAPKRNFSDAVEQIVNSVKAQYALTFVPAEGLTGARTLSVQATGANITAPKSYPHAN